MIKCFLLVQTDKSEKDVVGVTRPIWKRVDTGEEMTLRDAPAGAMYDARDFFKDSLREDGACLTVKLPDGVFWNIDGPSYPGNGQPPGPGWERTGEPPNITVTPSIQTTRYHGWLRNGELVPC